MGNAEYMGTYISLTLPDMRTFIIIACFVAGALAQTNRPDWFNNLQGMLGNLAKNDDVIDNVHEFRIEYHHQANKTHILLAISDQRGTRECHIVEIDQSWEADLKDPVKMHIITEDIYKRITDSNTPETTLTAAQLRAKYGDREATRECFRHTVKVLDYSPSD